MLSSYLVNLDFKNWDPPEIAKVISQIGYNGIEWTLDHFNPLNKESNLDYLVRVTKENNLEISELVIQQDYVHLDKKKRNKNIDLTIKSIEVAAKFNINKINLFTGPALWEEGHLTIPNDITVSEAWNLIFDAFDQIFQVAEKYKVYVNLEPCWGMVCHDLYSLFPYFERYHKNNFFGINFDPSHFVLYKNDIEFSINKLGKYIKHVHIKDVIGVPGKEGSDFIFPLIGEGMVDWSIFFKSLKRINYQGFCSVEFESYKYYNQILENNPVEAAKISKIQLDTLIKRFN
jgi:sugar phosphate isomerase/epimerase